MKKCFFTRFKPVRLRVVFYVVSCISVGIVSSIANAESFGAENSSLAAPSWGSRLQQYIYSSATVTTARQQRDGETLEAKAIQASRYYSPELTTEFEREGDANNYQFGLSQTIDWQGKGKLQRTVGDYSQQLASQRFDNTLLAFQDDVLNALVVWNAAAERATLAVTQQENLNALLALIRERQRSGDIGDIDAQLAVTGLSKGLMESANARIAVQESASRIQQLLPGLPSQEWVIPSHFWRSGAVEVSPENMQQWLTRHPDVRFAESQWQLSKTKAELVSAETTVDPTLGVIVGKSDTDNVVGLNLSIPLNLDNSRAYNADAQTQLMLSAESAYRAIRQQVNNQMTAAQNTLAERYHARTSWQSLMRGRNTQGEQLLKKQWRSGDLSTMDYLQISRSLMESKAAGIDIEEQYQLASIHWLRQTAQIQTVLTTRQTENK
ncbi:hypothetical protein A9Q99_11795 [Gammaproteobacteria bacterium 45_16_T64]|nr:hypothetical protein A9Q99_11795 [Gammaproteobacteria bacterium 45_16_T64]